MTLTMFLFYIPIAMVILSVFETLKQDDPGKIAKKVLSNFAVLTTILGASCAIIYLISP